MVGKNIIMENPMEENERRRPALLMVLCVLTFIYGGWTILSCLYSLFTADFFAGDLEKYSGMMGYMQDEGISSFLSGPISLSVMALQNLYEHTKEIAGVNLILNIISILGTIMMFQLRRPGFYFYAGAQIIILFVMPYFIGFSSVVLEGMFLSGLITVAFIVLYAVHLKYMR